MGFNSGFKGLNKNSGQQVDNWRWNISIEDHPYSWCILQCFSTSRSAYRILCFVDRAYRYNSCKWPTWRTVLFSYMFIPNLYMFRALMCSSSGELSVLIRHLVYVTVGRWPSVVQVWVEPKPAEWHIPDVVLIQLILLMVSTWVLETCRDLE